MFCSLQESHSVHHDSMFEALGTLIAEEGYTKAIEDLYRINEAYIETGVRGPNFLIRKGVWSHLLFIAPLVAVFRF